MDKEYRPIPGFEKYGVTMDGEVKHLRTGHIKTPGLNKTGGYYVVNLYDADGRARRPLVHRLVALAYIPNPDNLPQVNHKDENKQNNHVDNLEWCTEKYNSGYGTRGQRVAQSQLSGNNSVARKVMCINTGQVFPTARDANKWCGVNVTSVCLCCQGKQKWAGKHPETKERLVWKYVN